MRDRDISQLRSHLLSQYPDYDELEFAREVEKLIACGLKPVAFVYGREDDEKLLSLLDQLFGDARLKRPVGSWRDGRGSAIIESPAQFLRMLKEWGRLNLGVYLDKLAVIDIDDETLLPSFSPPQTLTVRTGGGGSHHYYKIEDEIDREIAERYKGVLKSSSKEHSEIRLKYKEVVLIPPSLHPSGRKYEVIVEREPPPLKVALPFIQWLKGEELENVRRGKEVIEEILGRPYESLPPCVRQALEIPYVHGVKHTPNPFLLFFFRTIGVSEENFVRIFLAFKVDADEKKTRKYSRRWTRIAKERGQGYLSHGCEKLQAAGLCPGCEFQETVKNPLTVYYHYSLGIKATPLQEEWRVVEGSIKFFFPYPKARPGQVESVGKILLLSLFGERVVFEAPTGYGKSPVIVAVAKLLQKESIPTLIVEPQRGLQDQLMRYGVFVLKGRKAYKCEVTGETADTAPCLHPRYQCEKRDRCKYKRDWETAHRILEGGGCVCINHGLYHHFKNLAKRVIFDEFHELCRSLSQEIWLQNCERELATAEDTILHELSARENELRELEEYIESLDPLEEEFKKAVKKREKLRSLINKLKLFLEAGCIVYERGKGKKRRVYAKMEEDVCGRVLLKRGYIGVSATFPKPLPENVEVVKPGYDVATRENAPIVYLPIVKLTMREAILTENANIQLAAEILCSFLLIIRENEEEEKFIIHCGNTHTHMQVLRDVLSEKFKVLVHEKGKMDQTIREFREGDYEVLLVAAANVGYDFFDYHYQFIFKLPYEDRNDPEWKAIEKKYGREEADRRYYQRLIDRIVQICGRICRGREDWGITYILDAKFGELYERYRDYFPDSFRKRLVFPGGDRRDDSLAVSS